MPQQAKQQRNLETAQGRLHTKHFQCQARLGIPLLSSQGLMRGGQQDDTDTFSTCIQPTARSWKAPAEEKVERENLCRDPWNAECYQGWHIPAKPTDIRSLRVPDSSGKKDICALIAELNVPVLFLAQSTWLGKDEFHPLFICFLSTVCL